MNANEYPFDWAAFYTAFEDRYRGSFDEIKNRLRYYVPILQGAGVGKKLGPVLDLGSGRGEWLELLRDSSIPAEGVDLNPHSAKAGSQRGLSITIGNLFDSLAKTSLDSCGAVTAFHVIEHLEWKDQFRLIHAAYQVLKPGGFLIVEWPNPENIYVASQYFWFDPTHLRLLPSQLVSFMAEFCGFEQIQLERFRPPVNETFTKKRSGGLLSKIFKWRKTSHTPQPSSLDHLSSLLTAGADIALIARKPMRP